MKYSYFTDIEEVVKWIYDHSERFYDKNNPNTVNHNSIGTTGTANNIRKLVSKKSILRNYCYSKRLEFVERCYLKRFE